MARINVNTRLERYAYRLNPERVREDFEAQKNTMISSAAEAFNDLATIEERVKAVLAPEPIPTVQYVWYHDFARTVYRLQKRFLGGVGLQQEVGGYVILWTRRGADEALLKKVSFEVFAIEPL